MTETVVEREPQPARRNAWRPLVAGLVVTDLAVYALTLLLAALALPQPDFHGEAGQHYLVLIALMLPVVWALFARQGLYDPQTLFAGSREYGALLRGCAASALALVVLSFAIHLPVSRMWTVLSAAMALVTMGAARFAGRRLRHRLRGQGLLTSLALLVGAGQQAVSVARQLNRKTSGIELVGVLDDYLPIGTVIAPGLEVLGPSSRLTDVAALTGARDVIVVPEALPWESLQAVLARSTHSSDRLRVHLVGGLYDMLAAGVRLSEHCGIPLLTVKKAALGPVEAALKRALDCGVSGALLVVLAPLAAFEALRLTVRGMAVLERRPILDRSGHAFDLLSFPADIATRSTLVRKLPSLGRVLAGQLSIVGPRPVAAAESGAAARLQPFALRPGLTGLWRQAHEPDEQLLLDLYYLRSYSIWLDLQVLSARLWTRLRVRGSLGAAGDLWPVRPT